MKPRPDFVVQYDNYTYGDVPCPVEVAARGEKSSHDCSSSAKSGSVSSLIEVLIRQELAFTALCERMDQLLSYQAELLAIMTTGIEPEEDPEDVIATHDLSGKKIVVS